MPAIVRVAYLSVVSSRFASGKFNLQVKKLERGKLGYGFDF